jgi:hypothetical protein
MTAHREVRKVLGGYFVLIISTETMYSPLLGKVWTLYYTTELKSNYVMFHNRYDSEEQAHKELNTLSNIFKKPRIRKSAGRYICEYTRPWDTEYSYIANHFNSLALTEKVIKDMEKFNRIKLTYKRLMREHHFQNIEDSIC